MKRLIAVVWFLALGLMAPAAHGWQQSTAARATSAAQSKIDPAKEADIRRLLELTGAKQLVVQTMQEMTNSIKPLLTSSLPPGEYREKLVELFFQKFQAKTNTQELLDMAVPVYDKYFSDEEVKGLIKFYETPLGQKSISALPQLMTELRNAGQKWGENLGRVCMQEVLAEHADLQEALQVAAKKQQQ